MTLVVDSSVVVAALTDTGPYGTWASTRLLEPELTAPQHLPIETAAALFRLERRGLIDADIGRAAMHEVANLPISLLPFSLLAERVWDLRHTVTAYDGWYVALAEATDSPLATLDRRLVGAPGPTCEFLTPAL